MKTPRQCARLLLALAAVAVAPAAFGASPAGLPWTTAARSNVAALTWSNDEIAAFLASVQVAGAGAAVGDFRFADLAGDGKLQLVASVDYSGRRFFNTILVVRRNGTVYSAQKLPALNAESLAGVVVDLDADGRQELVIPTALTPYLGAARPQAKWDAIYARSGAVYVENTAAYAGYTRANVAGPLRQRLVSASVANDSVALAVARIERDKAVRALPAGDTDAGLVTARALAADADPKLRILGAAVAADVGTADAKALLATLTRDADRRVAAYAGAAGDKARLERCSRVAISVLGDGAVPTVNLASAAPIRVAIASAASDSRAITFGESGAEQSLVGCAGADGAGRMVCEFGARESGLQVGDGVVTLVAQRADGSCVRGQDAVQVVAE